MVIPSHENLPEIDDIIRIIEEDEANRVTQQTN